MVVTVPPVLLARMVISRALTVPMVALAVPAATAVQVAVPV